MCSFLWAFNWVRGHLGRSRACHWWSYSIEVFLSHHKWPHSHTFGNLMPSLWFEIKLLWSTCFTAICPFPEVPSSPPSQDKCPDGTYQNHCESLFSGARTQHTHWTPGEGLSTRPTLWNRQGLLLTRSDSLAFLTMSPHHHCAVSETTAVSRQDQWERFEVWQTQPQSWASQPNNTVTLSLSLNPWNLNFPICKVGDINSNNLLRLLDGSSEINMLKSTNK